MQKSTPKKTGRPKKPPGEKLVNVSIRLKPEQRESLRRIGLKRLREFLSSFEDEKCIEDSHGELKSRIAELTIDAERYKIVRRMNPRKFGEVWRENVTTGLHFDWLIDAMKTPNTERSGAERPPGAQS